MKQTLAFFFCLALLTTGLAQNQNNIWYFGNAGVDFNSGSPLALTNSAMSTHEGCATICDVAGNLLFYTNGGNNPGIPNSTDGHIWNAIHQVMDNGDMNDTAGCKSAQQGTLILPLPDSNGIYYVLTVDCVEDMFMNQRDRGLRYTKVDMSFNGGLGKVVEKGVQIYPVPSFGVSTGNEVLTAMPHANGVDYWIMFMHNSQCSILPLTTNGFGTPVFQFYGNGLATPSPANDHVLVRNRLFDFDASTGMASNPVTLDGDQGAFSPNGRFLYMKDNQTLSQYNITAANIPSSKVVLGNIPGDAHLAPDKKIYFIGGALQGNNWLTGRVECPNRPGTACNLNSNFSLNLGNRTDEGYPNMIQTPFYDAGDPCHLVAQEESQHLAFAVYPNPARNQIWVQAEEGEAVLVNGMGQVLMRDSVKGKVRWDVSGLPSGVYTVRLGAFAKRIVVSR